MPNHQKQIQYERIGDFVSIFRRGSKWYANFMEGGRQCRISLKTSSKKQARLSAMKIDNRLVAGDVEPHRDATAFDLIQAYRDHIASGTLADKTKQKYLRVLDSLRGQVSINTSAANLDYTFLDAFRARRLKEVSGSTTYDECVVALQMLKFGVRRRLLKSNPLAGYSLTKPKHEPQPCWTLNEGERIVNSAKEPYQTAFLVLLHTGLRSGELTHLQWADLDFSNNVIRIRPKSWTEGGRTNSWRPKTGDQRAVPMTPEVKSALRRITRKCEWVFCAPASRKYPDGAHRLCENRLLKALKPRLKELALDGKIHTFRHTFISVALTRGIPEATVREWVGHIDADILRRYSHIASTVSQEQMARLAARMSDT